MLVEAARDFTSSQRRMVNFGEILRIREIIGLAKQLDQHSVRTWGELVEHDCAQCEAVIFHERSSLKVNTYNVEPLRARLQSKLMLIGEIDFDDSKEIPVLKARIAVSLHEVNMRLFNEALDIRRQYIKSKQP